MLNVTMSASFQALNIPATARVVYAVKSAGMWCVHWVI